MFPPRPQVGGLLEPWAFGLAGPPARSLPPGPFNGTLPLARGAADSPFSLSAAAAASSWAPGGLLASALPGRRVNRTLGLARAYWSPADSDLSVTDMLLADGGCLCNPPLPSALQRKPSRLLAFCNFYTPLAPREAIARLRRGRLRLRRPAWACC